MDSDNEEQKSVCIREEVKQGERLGEEKVFALERTLPARVVEAEYVRTKKERYLRVAGIKYKWHGAS